MRAPSEVALVQNPSAHVEVPQNVCLSRPVADCTSHALCRTSTLQNTQGARPPAHSRSLGNHEIHLLDSLSHASACETCGNQRQTSGGCWDSDPVVPASPQITHNSDGPQEATKQFRKTGLPLVAYTLVISTGAVKRAQLDRAARPHVSLTWISAHANRRRYNKIFHLTKPPT